MDVRQVLARNVRRLRQARGWSQEETASAASLHPTYLSEIENAKRNPTIMVVARLAEALEAPVSKLFEDLH